MVYIKTIRYIAPEKKIVEIFPKKIYTLYVVKQYFQVLDFIVAILQIMLFCRIISMSFLNCEKQFIVLKLWYNIAPKNSTPQIIKDRALKIFKIYFL